MAKQTIDIAQSATANAQALNNNFAEVYEGNAALDQRVTELEANPSSGGSVDNHTAPVRWDYYGGNNSAAPAANIEGNPFHLGDVISMVNSVIYSEQINHGKMILPSYKQGTETLAYAHGSNLEIYDGKAYVSFFTNEVNTVDDFNLTKAMLVIIDLDKFNNDRNNCIDDYHYVAYNGLPVGNKVIASGAGDPCLHVANGVATVVFTCRLGDTSDATLTNSEGTMCYRDYNIANGTWSDIQVCEFIDKDGDTYDWTRTNFNDHIAQCGPAASFPWFNMFSQHAFDGEKYYIGVGASDYIPNGVIMTTTDFHTFTHWLTPEWRSAAFLKNEVYSIGMKYEMALTYDSGTLFVAIRRTAGQSTFVGHINVSTKTCEIDEGNANKAWRLIPGGDVLPGRPCFINVTGGFQGRKILIVNLDGSRFAASFDEFKFNTYADLNTSRVATAYKILYPAVAQDTRQGKGDWYISFTTTSDSLRIGFAKFTLPLKAHDVLPAMYKMVKQYLSSNLNIP